MATPGVVSDCGRVLAIDEEDGPIFDVHQTQKTEQLRKPLLRRRPHHISVPRIKGVLAIDDHRNRVPPFKLGTD